MKVSKAIDESRERFNDVFRDVFLHFLGTVNMRFIPLYESFTNWIEENRNENWEQAARVKGLDWFGVRRPWSLS